MSLIICPGIHAPEVTTSFIEGLRSQLRNNNYLNNRSENILIFPPEKYPAYSAFHVLQFLDNCGIKPVDRSKPSEPLIFIGFSAGVVGAIGAAWAWRVLGGRVKAFIAIDGWGVPLAGDFPIHRMSHDFFTHQSSTVLGSGEDSFYAAPPVSHLEIWRSPATTIGWWVYSKCGKSEQRESTNAARFLTVLLKRYGEF